MSNTRKILMVGVGAGLAFLALLGFGAVAYGEDDVLDPPHVLPYRTPVTESFTCADCVRGPYILQTNPEGHVPGDLTYLRVGLESAGGEDVDLAITTDYGVENGNLVAQDEWFVCVSASFTGQESCEFDAESVESIRGRTLYIFVINFDGPPGTTFTLTAEWEPHIPPCETVSYCQRLDAPPNTALLPTFRASSFRTEEDVFLFGYEVPEQAALWAVRVRAVDGEANVDAYVGRGMLDETESPRARALYALTSTQGEEFLILFRPESGFYWVAVENTTAEPQAVEIIAVAIFDVQELLSGQSVSGQVDTEQGLLPFLRRQLQTSSGYLSVTQYHLALTSQDLQLMQRLQIRFENESDAVLKLHIRFNNPVELEGGLVVSDLSLTAAAGSAVDFALSPRLLRALLESGDIYFGVEATQPTGQAFRLTVTTVEPQGTVQLLIDEFGRTQLEEASR